MENNSTTILLIGAIILIIVGGVLLGTHMLNPSNFAKNNIVQLNEMGSYRINSNTTNKSNKKLINLDKYYDRITDWIMTHVFYSYINIIIGLVVFIILLIIPFWKIYSDNKQPGWASIIPIYNRMVLYRIVEIDEYFAFLCLIPIAGIVIDICMYYYAMLLLNKKYGKSAGFYLGIVFLPIIFLYVLAFKRKLEKNTIFYDREEK